MKEYEKNFKVLLGYTKPEQYGERRHLYLEGFTWNCDWYWGGGYIGNSHSLAHFDGAFLDCPDPRGHPLGSFYDPWTTPPEYVTPERVKRVDNGASVWAPLEFFLDDVPEHISKNWGRIKDLYEQFYVLRDAAEVFQYGGHCTSAGRTEAEIDKEMARAINLHIAKVIIPEICRALGVE